MGVTDSGRWQQALLVRWGRLVLGEYRVLRQHSTELPGCSASQRRSPGRRAPRCNLQVRRRWS